MAARVRTEFPRTPTVREGIFIPLADGTRLAARVWLPDDADDDPCRRCSSTCRTA